MRMTCALITLFSAMPLFAADRVEDYRMKGKEFEALVKDVPRVTMQQVGVISSPLSDVRGFGLPGRWFPVKMINDTSVYIVKDSYHFLHPNLSDSDQTEYILWRNKRGEDPEIIIWECPDKNARAAHVAELVRLNEERRATAEARRDEAKKNRARRETERRLRTNARQEERIQLAERSGGKHAASQIRRYELLGMQRPLADAVMDRLTDRLTKAISSGDGETSETGKALDTVRQHIMAVMAIQLQMRDIQWCDAIQKHMAPNMWDTRIMSKDVLRESDPESVVTWLMREVERTTEMAEARVNDQENFRDVREIEDAMIGEEDPQ